MPRLKDSARRFEIEHLWVFAALILTGGYAWIQFVQLPYIGFNWATIDNSRIRAVYVPGGLQVGDHLVKFNSVPVTDFVQQWWLSPLDGLQPGDIIPLQVERNEQELTINWRVPNFTPEEFQSRLTNQWWLALVFWGFGLCTLLFVRPKDVRWRLLIAFNLLTGVWLAASGVSRWQIFFSKYALSGAMWLCLPVYICLHWEFPRPLHRWRGWLWGWLYLAALGLCAANWLLLLPPDSYTLGVAVGGLVSLVLLIARLFRHSDQQRRARLLLLGGGVTFLPPIVIGIVVSFFNTLPEALYVTLLGLPILPLTYFYVARLGQLGAFELRANRLFTAYLFFFLLTALSTVLVSLVLQAPISTNVATLLIILIVLAASLLAAFGLQPANRLFDRYMLGLTTTSEALLETYTRHIATRLDLDGVAAALDGQILLTMLVGQSALVRVVEGALQPVYKRGVAHEQLPAPETLPVLLAQAGRLRTPDELAECGPWIRVALPIVFEGKVLAVWLLGRRDPDDYYGPTEIEALKLIADQTAIALTNIQQAENLRRLYQANANRQEIERIHLAHELHDEVLGLLAALSNRFIIEEGRPHYETISARIRNFIAGLRPAMLNYGLELALKSLADDLIDRYGETCPPITVELDGDGARHDPITEQHIYRIIQQACDNALKHGRPTQITLSGRIASDEIALSVEDNGLGFELAESLDIHTLLAGKHFGLASMIERAGILNARLRIYSTPGRGTRLTLHFKPDPATSSTLNLSDS